ncbi:MAG TPA: hypothetical protein VFZ66_23660 [Herpetosiphonaceae bacterium]
MHKSSATCTLRAPAGTGQHRTIHDSHPAISPAAMARPYAATAPRRCNFGRS